MYKHNRYSGFTLAEILISLTVLGVLSALTVPALFQNIHDEQNKIILKKSISDFSNAHLQLRNANGGSLVGLYSSYHYSHQYLTALSEYLNIIRICQAGLSNSGSPSPHEIEMSKCMPRVTYKNLNPNITSSTMYPPWNDNDYATAVLSNGAVIFYMQDSSNGGSVFIDVNGSKPPNRGGYDLFVFTVYYNGMLGLPDGPCDRTSDVTGYRGTACTGYVLRNKDY